MITLIDTSNNSVAAHWGTLPASFTLPDGSVISGAQAGWTQGHYVLRDDTPPPPGPFVPSVEDVVRERERRLALGFDYNFGDARGVHRIGTTEQDMKGWDEVTMATGAMINLGAGSTTLTIVTNTGPATITALEWQQILLAATAARQPIWAASFILQAMSPIPNDYTADSHWA